MLIIVEQRDKCRIVWLFSLSFQDHCVFGVHERLCSLKRDEHTRRPSQLYILAKGRRRAFFGALA